MIRLLPVLFLLSCSSISPRLNYIEERFKIFVSDCRLMDGHLYVPRRRVSNAPPTPWEMTDAICWYDDDTPTRRIII